MSEPILSFEKILVDDVIVRDMAIVAVCNTLMRTMLPGCILGSHDMAIHACFGLITQIGIGFRNVKRESEKPYPDPKCQSDGNPPAWRRGYFSKYGTHRNRIRSTAMLKYRQK
jgi:hypothetical protein